MVALARREDQDPSVVRSQDPEPGAAPAGKQAAQAAGAARGSIGDFSVCLGANSDQQDEFDAGLCLVRTAMGSHLFSPECGMNPPNGQLDEEEDAACTRVSHELLVQLEMSSKVAAQAFSQVTSGLRGLTRGEDAALPEFLTLGRYVDAYQASGMAGEATFARILSKFYVLRRALTTSSLPTTTGEPLGTHLARIVSGEFGGAPELDVVPNVDVSGTGEDEFRVPFGPIALRGKEGDERWQWARSVRRVMHTSEDFLEFVQLVDAQTNPTFGCVQRCDWEQVVIGTLASRLSRTVDGRIMTEYEFHGIVEAIERMAQASAEITNFFLMAGATTAFGNAGTLEKIATGIRASSTSARAVTNSINYHGLDALWNFGDVASGLFSLGGALADDDLAKEALAMVKAYSDAVNFIGTDPQQAKTLKVLNVLAKSAAGK